MSTQQPAPEENRRSVAAKPIVIVTAIVGGVALIGAGGAAAYAAIPIFAGPNASSGATSGELTSSVSGIDSVEIDVDAADFTLQFGDVDEAELELTGPRSDRWTMDRDGDELHIGARDSLWDFCFGWCMTDSQTAVLTLPKELERNPVDVDLSLAAGQVSASGAFRSFELDMSAGKSTIEGTARDVSVSMSAGASTIDLADVETAAFEVSAGGSDARFTGTAPRELDLELSAGALNLEVPDEIYKLVTDVSAGTVDHDIRTDPDASRIITAEVSAGRISLTPGS